MIRLLLPKPEDCQVEWIHGVRWVILILAIPVAMDVAQRESGQSIFLVHGMVAWLCLFFVYLACELANHLRPKWRLRRLVRTVDIEWKVYYRPKAAITEAELKKIGLTRSQPHRHAKKWKRRSLPLLLLKALICATAVGYPAGLTAGLLADSKEKTPV